MGVQPRIQGPYKGVPLSCEEVHAKLNEGCFNAFDQSNWIYFD